MEMDMLSYKEVLTFAQSWDAVYFFALFVIVLIYVFWPSNQRKFEEAASIPLHDGDDK
jgi:cytochrome c oxidase cbb3-type subunit 4